jgi:hypothetical protein
MFLRTRDPQPATTGARVENRDDRVGHAESFDLHGALGPPIDRSDPKSGLIGTAMHRYVSSIRWTGMIWEGKGRHDEARRLLEDRRCG